MQQMVSTIPLEAAGPSTSRGVAVSAYKQTSSRVETPREVDAMVLLDSADKMEMLKKLQAEGLEEQSGDNSFEAILTRNRLIWTVIMAEMTKEHPLPLEIKANLVNLGLFVDVQTAKALGTRDPVLLDALININRNIAAGLMAQLKPETAPQNAPQPAQAAE